MRDFDEKPYTTEENRVAEYLSDILPDLGQIDDPMGLLLSSLSIMIDDKREQVRRIASTMHIPAEVLVPPECKEDVVDLLFRVQVGQISCRRASALLFPQFERRS